MKIMVCSDGSERAREALLSAAIISVPTRADITILGITEIEQDQGRLLEALREDIEGFQKKCIKLDIVTKFGDPVKEIIQHTREITYDLVVISAERQRAQEFFLPSAKAYSIIETIVPPVLVVPKSRPNLKRILICSCGGPWIDSAVRVTVRSAKAACASSALLTLISEPWIMHTARVRPKE